MNNTNATDVIIQVIKEADLCPDIDQRIRDGLVECFPKDREYFSKQSWWHSKPFYRVVAFDGEIICGHTAIVERQIKINSTHLRIAGVQSVFVLLKCRGRGLSDRIMIDAMNEAAHYNMDAGLLFCAPTLQNVYSRTGWLKVDSPVFMKDENGKKVHINEKGIAMFHPLTVKNLPAGEIDLCGQDW